VTLLVRLAERLVACSSGALGGLQAELRVFSEGLGNGGGSCFPNSFPHAVTPLDCARYAKLPAPEDRWLLQENGHNLFGPGGGTRKGDPFLK
jgi:hypothetical protein